MATDFRITQLKARLFELTEEKETLKNNLEMLKAEVKEADDIVDNIRGELNTAINIAEKRADMIREIMGENRELKKENERLKRDFAPFKPNHVIKSEIAEEVREETIKQAIKSLEAMITPVRVSSNSEGWVF